MMIGTLVNVGAIIVGTLVGVMIHSRLPQKIVDVVFQGIGLITITLGISMSVGSSSMILVVVSVVSGAIIGEALKIEERINALTDKLKNRTRSTNERFVEGVVTASVLFCVGSMAILGSIEDGLGQTPNLLLTKSLMDGVASVAFATSFGICVIYSTIPVLLYQGAITLLAGYAATFLSEAVIAELTAVGGILLIGLGISILGIKKISVTNMLPSLIIVIILAYLIK